MKRRSITHQVYRQLMVQDVNRIHEILSCLSDAKAPLGRPLSAPARQGTASTARATMRVIRVIGCCFQ